MNDRDEKVMKLILLSLTREVSEFLQLLKELNAEKDELTILRQIIGCKKDILQRSY
jgi:hypothetical protein